MNQAEHPVVGVIDVGAPRTNLGWALVDAFTKESLGRGDKLDDFIARSAEAAAARPLAVGFEAPMFVPLRDRADTLTQGRPTSDGAKENPAWSGGPGALVLAQATVIVPYTLTGLARRLGPRRAVMGREKPRLGRDEVYFFEAFVSGAGKATDGTHAGDAHEAAIAFADMYAGAKAWASAALDQPAFNLLAAALLRTGWIDDPAWLHRQPLVVRPGYPPC